MIPIVYTLWLMLAIISVSLIAAAYYLHHDAVSEAQKQIRFEMALWARQHNKVYKPVTRHTSRPPPILTEVVKFEGQNVRVLDVLISGNERLLH